MPANSKLTVSTIEQTRIPSRTFIDPPFIGGRLLFCSRTESRLHRVILVFCGVHVLPVPVLDSFADLGGCLSFARLFIGIQSFSHADVAHRSEERRVGKEGRSRWSPYH